MTKLVTSGSVGGPEGNLRLYPEVLESLQPQAP